MVVVMPTSLYRPAVVSRLDDDRIMARLDILCTISPQTPNSAVSLSIDVHRFKGPPQALHYDLPLSAAYNMPFYLHNALKDAHVLDPHYSNPLLTNNGQCSALVNDFVDIIIDTLYKPKVH